MNLKLSVLLMVVVVLLGGCSGFNSDAATDTELQGTSADISTDTQAKTDTQQTPVAHNTQQRETVTECHAQQTATPTCDIPRESADSKHSPTAAADTSPTNTHAERPPTDDGTATTPDESRQSNSSPSVGELTATPPTDDGEKTAPPSPADGGDSTVTPPTDDESHDGAPTATPPPDDGEATPPPPADGDGSADGSRTDTPATEGDDGSTTPPTTPASDMVTLENVTVEAICTDYNANTATFQIINNDDDPAIVGYLTVDAAGGSGSVTIPPGESVRVTNISTTSIVSGLEQGAITLFVQNARGPNAERINYRSDPSPCGDTLPTQPHIVFPTQTTFYIENFAVTLPEVALPEGGFVVFTNQSGAVVDTSFYIGAGIAHQVDIDLYQAFPSPDAGDQITVTATLYRDTNNNKEFDPKIDQPYESTDGDTSATATVTYGGRSP